MHNYSSWITGRSNSILAQALSKDLSCHLYFSPPFLHGWCKNRTKSSTWRNRKYGEETNVELDREAGAKLESLSKQKRGRPKQTWRRSVLNEACAVAKWKWGKTMAKYTVRWRSLVGLYQLRRCTTICMLEDSFENNEEDKNHIFSNMPGSTTKSRDYH